MRRVESDRLTIVLTLKDRAPFTYRWMRYMNDVRCPYPILIADGGADLAVQAELEQPERYPHLRYTYLRYPFDRDDATYYRKFADVVDQVKTPYVMLADNDDFVLLDPLPQCLDYLGANASFVACGGKRIVLRLLGPDGVPRDAATAKQYQAIADDRPASLIADSGVERVCAFLANVRRQSLWASWHHVLRTAAVQRSAAVVRAQDFHDSVAFELHMHMHWLLTGNYMTIDVPALVKQEGGAQLTALLNAQATVFERFIVTNAFADLRQSLSLFSPAFPDVDRIRIEQALVRWIAREAPAARTQSGGDRAPAMAHFIRRALHPFRGQPASPVGPPIVRLPSLETYLLD